MARFRVHIDDRPPRLFPSEAKAYAFIHGEGRDLVEREVRVYEDEGRGWHAYEKLTVEELNQ